MRGYVERFRLSERNSAIEIPMFVVAGTPLCSVPVVVLQKPTKPLTTLNAATSLPDFLPRFDEYVGQPLMISLPMEMEKVLAYSITQRSLAEKDYPI